MMQPIVQKMQTEALALTGSTENQLGALFAETPSAKLKRQQLSEKCKRLENAEQAIKAATKLGVARELNSPQAMPMTPPGGDLDEQRFAKFMEKLVSERPPGPD